MRMFLLAFIGILSSGCVGVGRAGMALYDIGLSSSGSAQSPGLLLRSVEVQAPSWLASPAMQYRLAYTAGARREAYAESRWVAPPAELLELSLKRRMLADEARAQAVGCRLHVELIEFVQVFDAPGASRALLEIRATLLAPRGDILLARRAFSQSSPAGMDARAGAAAFAAALPVLADEVVTWLAERARETPEVVLRCRGV